MIKFIIYSLDVWKVRNNKLLHIGTKTARARTESSGGTEFQPSPGGRVAEV
jgi:hypothetical protein